MGAAIISPERPQPAIGLEAMEFHILPIRGFQHRQCYMQIRRPLLQIRKALLVVTLRCQECMCQRRFQTCKALDQIHPSDQKRKSSSAFHI